MIRSRIAATSVLVGIGSIEPQTCAIFDEHAVGHDEMEVNVYVHQTPEAPHELTAPVSGVRIPRLRATRRCHAPIARTTTPPVQLIHIGSRARTSRSRLGTVNTHCRYGAHGSMRSTRRAAVSAMRQLGQMPRRLARRRLDPRPPALRPYLGGRESLP
jgi:hypothetical protein